MSDYCCHCLLRSSFGNRLHNKRGVKKISDHKEICIIGAGASGLAAAISASRAGAHVCVLEHKNSAAKKLSITGNGKCNFTNLYMDASCFHNANTGRISQLLERFSPEDSIQFFKSLGFDSFDKYGYVYPDCENAIRVAEVFESNVDDIRYNVSDINIDELRDRYDAVIIACGSMAYKKTGSDGSGYKILEKLGVRYTRILPALCPVICDSSDLISDYPSKRLPARVCVMIDGERIAEDIGEVQIKDDGVSGIPVMNLSRYVSKGIDNGQEVYLIIETDIKDEDLPEIVRNRSGFNGISNQNKIYRLKSDKLSRFDHSQVCTGGVSWDMLDDNFMLKSVPDVYVVGEMVDVDGKCGGYNLHFAIASGCIAGKAAAL